LSLAFPFAGARAGADPVSDSQNHLAHVNGQLAQAQAQAAQLQRQLQADGVRLDVLSQQYEVAQEQLSQLDAQLVATRGRIAQTEAQVAATEAVLRHAALQSYMTGATDAGFDALFAPGTEQAAVVAEYRQVAGGALTDAVDALHQAQAALAAQQAQLEDTAAQARAAAAQVASAEQQAQAVAAQQRAALGQVRGQVATLLSQEQQAKQAVAAALYQQELAAEQARGGSALRTDVAVSPGAAGAVRAAETQLGVPYRWGAESPKGSPDPGFDCSGLTQWSWRQAGVALPRTAQEQYDAVPHIPIGALQPGDLVFWNDGTASVQHVGMYVGNGNVIDAPETGQDVQIQPIWTNGLVGAGRP
jgi:cell wall-associated NlpC family hydrolase